VTAKELTDEVLRRVRDVHGLAHSRAFARTLLSKSQQVLNTLLAVVTTSTTFTTQPHQQLYSISGSLTGTDTVSRVLAVREGGRDLSHLKDYRQLSHLNLRWLRAIGTRFEAWTHIGRDLLVIYPAKTSTSSVEIIGSKLTTALTGEATELEVPSEYHDHIVTLAEIMLLAKQRDLEQAMRQLKLLSEKLPIDTMAIKLHLGEPHQPSAGAIRA
jgi:hypothetical protein